MAVRDKLQANTADLLQPGEQVQAVFSAQAVNPWLAIISFWIIIFKNAYRIVLVTDRRIIVLQAGKMSITQNKGVLRELPRATKIGPPAGLWYITEALGEKLWIHKRWAKDIEAADTAEPAAA
jgi:hypothetical protein